MYINLKTGGTSVLLKELLHETLTHDSRLRYLSESMREDIALFKGQGRHSLIVCKLYTCPLEWLRLRAAGYIAYCIPARTIA